MRNASRVSARRPAPSSAVAARRDAGRRARAPSSSSRSETARSRWCARISISSSPVRSWSQRANASCSSARVALREAGVRDLGDQDVLEAERALAGDRRAILGDDELARDERVDQRAEVEDPARAPRTAPCQKTRPITDARCSSCFCSGGERVDPRRDQRLDRVRDVVPHPLALREHPHASPRGRADCPRPSRRRARAAPRAGPSGWRPSASSSLSSGVSGASSIARRAEVAASPRRPQLEQLGPRDADDQERRVAHRARDVLDHVQQRLLGPVDVLEDEHERLHVRELLRPRARGPEELLALVLALARADQSRRGREQIGDRVALAARAQLVERLADRVVVGDPGGLLRPSRRAPST